jgi:hypothetical protein
MRYKLIAFSLPFVFAAKAFAAPGGLACDWVDKEALAAFGLSNAESKEPSSGIEVQGSSLCTFAAPDSRLPSLTITAQPDAGIFVLKPVCNWIVPPHSDVEIGLCYMNVGHSSAVLNLAVSSSSNMQSILSAQLERLYNKQLESAPK